MNITKIITGLTLSMLLASGVAIAADYDKGMDAYESGDYKAAIEEWMPLAELGDPRAERNIGFMYYHGKGVLQNSKTALRWFILSAEQGYAKAQYNLGNMYRTGTGVLKNDKTAVKWFTLAAEQGFSSAQLNLGIMYANGYGVPENDKTAVKWLTLAAEQGDADARSQLDAMSDNGEGAEQEVFRAFSCSVVAQGNRKMSMAFCSGLIDTQLELSGFKANHPNRLALKDNVSAYKRIDKQCGYTNFYGSGNTFADEFETGGLDPTLAFIAYSADPSAANLKKAQNPTFHKGCMGIFKNHMDDINHLRGLK
jgi:TPR repeat protein